MWIQKCSLFFRNREQVAASRKDANRNHVIINEKIPKAVSSFTVANPPSRFKTKEAYEFSIRHPIGQDFNPLSSVADFTRPPVCLLNWFSSSCFVICGSCYEIVLLGFCFGNLPPYDASNLLPSELTLRIVNNICSVFAGSEACWCYH